MLYKFVLTKKKNLSPTKKMERCKDSIDLYFKPLSKCSLLLNIENKKVNEILTLICLQIMGLI